MGVDYKVSQLYDAAIRRIAGSQVEWKQILKLAGQLYRYEFDNILMVYMQRPKATLVADFGTWKKVGRYVRKGSRGIAIFPSRALRAGMRHVFDISDTGGRQQELTWRLHAGNREAYAAYLYQESGTKKTEWQEKREAENEENRSALQTIASFLEKRIELLVETEFADRVAEFRKLVESRQQPHLTEQEQTGIIAEALLQNSIRYVVRTRCGLEISPENQDFSVLSAFSSEEEIYCLGSLVSDVSCMVLRSVAKELAQVERGRIHDRGVDLSQNRGRDVVSRPDSIGGRSLPDESRQIRSTGSGVSQGELPGEVSGTRPVREAGGDHAGGGRGSEPDDGRVGRGLPETPSTERVQRDDGSMEIEGAGEEAGGGNRDDRNRADLPLGTKKEKDGQLSFLLLPDGETNPPEKTLPEVRLSENTSPVPPEYVRQVLLAGSGFTKGKQRIYNLFVSVPDAEERARRIKKEYGQGGAGWSVEGDGLRGYDTIGTNGIRFRWQEQGEEREGLLGWERVEQEIHTLIQAGEYYIPPVLLNPEQITPSLWQEPLDRFFREMVREKMTDMNWKEVLSGACPESYQIHLVEEACHPDRFLSFSQSRLENSYGPCAIECDRKGISVEFYNQDGKKGKIELEVLY